MTVKEFKVKTFESDTTVLIATHQINYLNEADYIYHLKDGKLIEEGAPEILENQTEIGQAYERFIASAASASKPSGSEGLEKTSKTANEDTTDENIPGLSAGKTNRSETGPRTEEDSLSDEEIPLMEPNSTCSTKEKDKRDQANPSTYYRVVKFGVGFGLVGILLLLYLISIGLCQATVYWFGLWMDNLRNVCHLML